MPSATTVLAPDTRLDIADAALPQQYLTDRGKNRDDEERTRWIRADLRDYALAVRDADRTLADELGWRLQTFPWAVCVLGPNLPDGWNGFVARMHRHVEAEAAAVSVAARPLRTPLGEPEPWPTDWNVSPTGMNNQGMADAYELAKAMFCPSSGTRRGDPAEHLPGWEPFEDHELEFNDQVMEYWVFAHDWGEVRNPRTAQAGAAYAVTAAIPNVAPWSAADARLFTGGTGCFSDLARLRSLAGTSVAPDRWIMQGAYVDDAMLTSDEVNSDLAIFATAEAVVEVGCPAVIGHR